MVICEICNKECKNIRGYHNHKANKHNPDVSRKISQNTKKALNTPEVREKLSELSKRNWQNEDYRKRLSESISKRNNDPEYKARYAKNIKRSWEDPEKKAVRCQHIHEALSTPEANKKLRELAKEQYRLHKDNYKLHTPECFAKKRAIARSPEHRALMSEIVKERWANLSDEERIAMIEKWNGIRGKAITKSGKTIPTDSTYEQTFCELMLKDDSIQDFDRPNFTIQLPTGHRYFPDFLVTFKDGHKDLVEIKSAYTVTFANVQIKVQAAKEYCKEHDMTFKLFKEQEIDNYRNALTKER